MIESEVSFGFETVGSHPSKVELLQRAKQLGYRVALLFVATESSEINIRRIKYRVSQGGHDVPDEKVRSRYERTLKLLPEYFSLADTASIWDNSEEGACCACWSGEVKTELYVEQWDYWLTKISSQREKSQASLEGCLAQHKPKARASESVHWYIEEYLL